MKGIIRIAGLDYKGSSWTYWNLFVVREMVKRVKKEVGSTGVTNFHIFFVVGRDRYRVDYLIVSCTSSSWDRLRRELEWRYVCVDKCFKFNKKKHSWVRTEVNFWLVKELENELSDVSALINCQNRNPKADFEIIFDGSPGECPFYKPFDNFRIGIWKGDYRKNCEAGRLVLSAERKWKRDGGEKKWRKRKAWKTVGGNYKEVK